ncbi:IS30 family transposase [Flavobacterium psychrophilum]|uniref:IS30 family transposase n=3 Tax=Flavobacterium psychrophilum TaxID=96345 RepID=UPI001C8F1EF3|nr:IS30 family transposase [Flavobacterium psychrophilum]EKT4501929.1 IS30 family transposase [Flavobacterium psychrophilum]EKT4553102.1 IS30 family transposase [Flavobacterium psychrophilum]ELM3651581.1 IS30 family transposase [Flavobacterium psychrophilum]ELM3672597.1 IS30 family transposase [Flavobacterium psychrophilum]ELM3727161.1 IS30 family transposase [Flavobacterium psychrophilum]
MSHFTVEQRYKLEVLLQQNVSKTQISIELNKHISSIYREINRNSDARNAVYKGSLAIKKCNKRHKEKIKNQCFTSEIKTYVENSLIEDLSPEQIVGRALKDRVDCVCIESIYKYVWRDKKQSGTLYTHLRNQGKTYRKPGASKDKRGLIVGRIGIENRPKEVEEKQRFGDLEIDLVIGKDHKGALLTINDRATGMLQMKKIESKDSEIVKNATIELLENWKPFLQTITSDNGKEFAKHEAIAKSLEIDYYFANPYCSWERGANENLNGLVRQYFPKGSDFSLITQEQVTIVVEKLNNRPRKRHQFNSPNEVYLQILNNNQEFAFIN